MLLCCKLLILFQKLNIFSRHRTDVALCCCVFNQNPFVSFGVHMSFLWPGAVEVEVKVTDATINLCSLDLNFPHETGGGQ